MRIHLKSLEIDIEWLGPSTSTQVVVMVHGIMGNKKNLASITSKLALTWPGYRFLSLDLRNHGQSSKHQEPYTIEACAKDIAEVAKALDIYPTCIIGHSFGAKVALIATELLPCVTSVWLLDASPGIYEPKPLGDRGSFNAFDVIDLLEKGPKFYPTRRHLIDYLLGQGAESAIAAWMTTNLQPSGDGFELVFAPGEMARMLTSFVSTDLWPLVTKISSRAEVHLVAAERGLRVSSDDEKKLINYTGRRGFFHLLPDAGHFLHVDNPTGLLGLLAKYPPPTFE